MTERPRTPQITITDREPGLPFSKGLQASHVMVTGLSPYRAYQIAEEVEIRLHERRKASLTSVELADLTLDVIRELAGDRYAMNFERWRQVEELDVPLVILIGGATGVGKSTIATQLAARLGIVRVVATDAIREVMRAMLSQELMPSLHQSTFTADEAFADTLGRSADSLVLGFGRQAHAVSVGTHALIERAAAERTSLVIEGAHVVPGYLELDRYADRILAVPFVVTVTDEERHLAHFAARQDAVASRPAERYVAGFDNIRSLQDYIKRQALAHGVPVIPNYSFDQSIAAVIDLVMERVTARAGQSGAAAAPTGTTAGAPAAAGEGRTA